MPLPRFELLRPKTGAEAVARSAEAGAEARFVAGGTDLLVAMKQGTQAPRRLVALSDVAELRGIGDSPDGGLDIGAGEPLADLAHHAALEEIAPALAQGCARVGHPQIRAMGTLGGNVCLDVRCHFVNRPAPWREALGGCLKTDGPHCRSVIGATRCTAALSGDTIAPLVALNSSARLLGPDGPRTVPVQALRLRDGRDPLGLRPHELVLSLHVPAPPADVRRRSAYHKWAPRRAVDFPLVSVALVVDTDAEARLVQLRVAVAALGPQPRVVAGLDAFRGERLTPNVASAAADLVHARCHPLPNLLFDAAYRRELLRVLVHRQLLAWAH